MKTAKIQRSKVFEKRLDNETKGRYTGYTVKGDLTTEKVRKKNLKKSKKALDKVENRDRL